MIRKTVSIIIPTWNEEENVKNLITKITSVMKQKNITHEMIFIDDNSNDNTVAEIKKNIGRRPINVYLKKGSKGKAHSLVEGFAHAKYPVICMIDADLQYPPSAIPKMLEKIASGYDIVVADRRTQNINLKRKIASKGYNFFFSRLLHRLTVDTQSGLKVFRRDVFYSLELHPSNWALDMEFLLKAKKAGYLITSLPIVFNERHAGKAKINIMKTSLQLAINAILLKFVTDVPVSIYKATKRIKWQGVFYKGTEFIHHTSLPHSESALTTVTRQQKLAVLTVLFAFSFSLFLNWHLTLLVLIAAITTLYFCDLVFNLFLIYRSFAKSPEITITDEEIDSLPDSYWPTYTIYCPLYKEWSVVPQFISAISNLDYPKNKLQVMLLLEEDDKETIRQVKEYTLPAFFKVVVVPDSKPKTKPKALNYGLLKTKGEYVVVYDAEDIPDPKQLKKAVLAFKKEGEKTICVQAKLNFYNPYQNILTRVFTAEYSLWFDLVLTGLQSIEAPIPLGGTSNHFRTRDIRALHGWDAFNVTEDCDLGTRLAKHGYKTAIIESTTLEEANSDTKNWFNQRSRWIKGYIQTYFVHMRSPQEFFKNKKSHLIAFQFVVGGKILSLFVNPFLWLSTISYFALRPFIGEFIESFFPAPILYMAVFALIVGNFLYLYYYMIGLAKRGYEELIPFAFFVPFYWLAMSFASWIALFEFIVKPHYWSKTQHGLHLTDKKSMDHAATAVGRTLVDRRFAVYPLDISPALKKGW